MTIPAGFSGFTSFQSGVVNLSISSESTFYLALGYLTSGHPDLGVDTEVNPLLQTRQFLYDGSTWQTAQAAGKLAEKSVMIEGIWGIKGDLDDSGRVSLGDAVRMVDHLLDRSGSDALTVFEQFEADIDNNQDLNLGDVVQMIDVVLGRS